MEVTNSTFELRTLDKVSEWPGAGMGAGAYRLIEGVIDFAIAIIDTLGSLFDSQEGTTSAQGVPAKKI